MSFDTNEEVKNYFVIFHKIDKNQIVLVCIVENEDIAIQFCKDHEEFCYFKRDEVLV